MKWRFIMVVIRCCGVLGFTSCDNGTVENRAYLAADESAVDSVDLIKRGSYLVAISGCNDCHSPKMMTPQGPVPDAENLLAGYSASRPFKDYNKQLVLSGSSVMFNIENTAFAGPWGLSFAANLTPDDTGLGNWSLEQFDLAMRKGKWKGIQEARSLLPPMPWQNYQTMTDEDLSAIFAYLKSIKPVKNLVPANIGPNAL